MVWKHVQVLELWTRRRFRCDCGNSKFGVGICRLQANKEPENSCNIYNQNYKGVYCICKRPHPDPDLPEQCEMLQCCICEDWFHEHHLGLPPSLQVLFSGFCCRVTFNCCCGDFSATSSMVFVVKKCSLKSSCFVMLESMSLQ